MVPFLYTPREHHSVTTPEDYSAKHAAFIAKKAAQGQRFAVHEVSTPMTARVDANTWLIDCDCGAGNATDPDWGVACCFGCGAIHTQVIFPADADLIAAVLTVRPRVLGRGWEPAGYRGRERDQTVDDLLAENASLGLDDVPALVARAALKVTP